MASENLEEARNLLRIREKIPKNRADHIGVWSTGEPSPASIADLPEWANQRGVQYVVWTKLGSQFNGIRGYKPTVEEVIQYLYGLDDEVLAKAKEYIIRAPRQTDTVYRRRIEAEFGWTPLDGDE